MKIVLGIAALLATTFAFGQMKVQPGSVNKVEIEASALFGMADFTITGGVVEGELKPIGDKVEGDFEVALQPLKTGQDMRDDHMHDDYLETKKFPKAKLKLKPWKPTSEWSDFVSILTIKGQDRPFVGKARMLDVAGEKKVEAKGIAKISEYPIKLPVHGKVTLGDELEMSIQFMVK